MADLFNLLEFITHSTGIDSGPAALLLRRRWITFWSQVEVGCMVIQCFIDGHLGETVYSFFVDV